MTHTKRTFLQIALLFVICCSPITMAQVSFGKPEKINDNWRFNLGDTPNAVKAGFNDQRWQKVHLPHDWSVEGQLSPTLSSCTGNLPGGIGWYRKSLQIPDRKSTRLNSSLSVFRGCIQPQRGVYQWSVVGSTSQWLYFFYVRCNTFCEIWRR